MSLIEEALRRIQDPLLPAKPQASKPAPQAQPAKKRPRQAEPSPVHPWPTAAAEPPAAHTPVPTSYVVPATASAIVGAAVLFLIGGMLWLTGVRRDAPPQPASPIHTHTIAAPTPAPTASQHDQNLIFTGTVEGEGEPYAVINGAVVAIGEQIGEATLLEITKGVVKLRHRDGREILLQVPR